MFHGGDNLRQDNTTERESISRRESGWNSENDGTRKGDKVFNIGEKKKVTQCLRVRQYRSVQSEESRNRGHSESVDQTSEQVEHRQWFNIPKIDPNRPICRSQWQ
jgi:hypothetical protein